MVFVNNFSVRRETKTKLERENNGASSDVRFGREHNVMSFGVQLMKQFFYRFLSVWLGLDKYKAIITNWLAINYKT